MTRIAFALAGLAMLAYGAWLAWDFATARTINAVQGAAWFVGGPILHDAVVAPVVGVVGMVLTRYVPVAWRAPVAVGAVLSGVLTLLAIPLLWRPFGVVTNPGLHDRDYGLGFAIALGVVWGCVLAVGAYRRWRHGTTQPTAAQGHRDGTQPPTTGDPPRSLERDQHS